MDPIDPVVLCPSPRCRGKSIPAKCLVKHLKAYHKGENIVAKCPYCEKTDLKMEGLKSHIRRWHQREPKTKFKYVQKTFDSTISEEEPQGSQDIPMHTGEEETAQMSMPVIENVSSNLPSTSSEPSENILNCDTDVVISEIESAHAVLSNDDLGYVEEVVNLSSDSESEVEEDKSENSGNNFCTGVQEARNTLQAGKFLLAMRSCGVNSTQMKVMMKETHNLLEYVCDSTMKKLSEGGCKVDSPIERAKVKHELCDVFTELRSVYRQDKYFTEKLNVIKPKSVQVDFKLMRIGEGKTRRTTKIERDFYYVPILSVLEKLLKHPDYDKITTRHVDSDPDILDCYLKGELAKKNIVLKEHPDALRLILYFDEVETCGALSSRAAGKQKLGAFYLTLDNIDPKYRASLSSISLVALVESSQIKEHGVDFVLERIMKDLKQLETGVMMNGKMTYGTLIAFTGDNLGSHLIGGFKCGFNAYRMCRDCTLTQPEIQTEVRENPEKLRTIEQYEIQVLEIENARTLKARDEKSTEYGIVKSCLLNKLQSFHVLFGLPPDLLHDILEGSLIRILKFIIKYCVEEIQVVTLTWLNQALADFDYGYSEKNNKPSPIRAEHLKDDGNLRQSAAQLWTLGFVLPLVLGPSVDEDDEHWENYTTLLEIIRMLFSGAVSKKLLPYLSDLISSFLSGYQRLYGHLLPKDHFLTHYATLLRLFGTLLDFMCMRMEANHQFFKRLVYSLGNYKNIPKSLTLKHQFKQALAWSKPLVKNPVFGPVHRVKLQELPFHTLVSGTDEVVETKWMRSDGFLFKKENCYICTGFNLESRPVFARVVYLIVWPEIYLVCNGVLTEYYDTHLSAYKINDGNNFQFYKVAQIKGKRVFHGHYVGNCKYITLKEGIGDSF